MGQLREQVSLHALDAALTAVDSIALEVSAATGATRESVVMLLTQMLIDGATSARWVKAGSARATGVPVTGMLDALGMSSSSPTSITRMAAEIDAAAEAQQLADQRGEPVTVRTDDGTLLRIQPTTAFFAPDTLAELDAAGVGEYDTARS